MRMTLRNMLRYLLENCADYSGFVLFSDVTPPVFKNCPNGTIFTKKPGVYDISVFATVSKNICLYFCSGSTNRYMVSAFV